MQGTNGNNDTTQSKYSEITGLGIFIGAKPGSIVERHIGSTMGQVVCLSPLQTGILRRFLPNGYVEFLLGDSIVKLEPGYELKVTETIAIRRRPELKAKRMQGMDIAKGNIIILKQIIANIICKDPDTMKKLESLYSVNGEIINVGRVVAIYPEGLVLSSNFLNSSDFNSWIFLGDNDLKEIRVLNTDTPEVQINQETRLEYEYLENILSLDAGMTVTIEKSDIPHKIESIWWTKGNILNRKAFFDGGRLSASILTLSPYKDTLQRETAEIPPPERSYLRLYTEFQNPDGLMFSICGYDEDGVIANYKPPSSTISDKATNSRGRCWVPFSFFDDPSINTDNLKQSTDSSIPQITSSSVDTFVTSPSLPVALGKRTDRPEDSSEPNSPKKVKE